MIVDIVIALITGLCVAIPSVIATYASNSKNNALIAYQVGELKTEISNLKKEISKSNGTTNNKFDEFKEQISHLESRVEVLETKMGLYHGDKAVNN